MKPDVMINGISMVSLGWLRESVSFPIPQSQAETITVPGRNSPIRFSEALGRVAYHPRTFEMVFSMLGNRTRFNSMVRDAANRFSGSLCQVVCSEEPGLYALGTLETASEYDPMTGKGILTFTCEDGDAYRYYTEETVVTISGSGTVLLTNDYMPVVPVVTTTEETTLSFAVGDDIISRTVSAGTWEFADLELQQGGNTIRITGNGETTFRYREGCL